MAPFIATGVGERCRIASIGHHIILDKRGRHWRSPRLDGHQPAVDLVELQCQGVSLGEIQPPVWRQKLGDDLRPATDVGQPNERSPSNESYIVLIIERSRRIVDISLDKAHGHVKISS